MYPLTAFLVVIGLIILLTENLELKLIAFLMIIYTIPSTLVANMKLKGERLFIHENWILIPFLLFSFVIIVYGILKILDIFTLLN